MKSVLISIKPHWCKLIASGKKTIEVRKTRPKCSVPFKCYIYCTNDYRNWATKSNNCEFWVGKPLNNISKGRYFCNGKVIGEFVCDEIYDCRDINGDDACITVAEWLKYTKGHKGKVYGWHISNLVIYDKPKELSEFYKSGILSYDEWLYGIYNGKGGATSSYESYKNVFKLKRPPQSWCYAEII